MPEWRRPLQRPVSCAALLALVLATGLSAQSSVNKGVTPQQSVREDSDFAREVKEWTTKPEFISPLVDHLPKVAGVPSPKDGAGPHVGAPGRRARLHARV